MRWGGGQSRFASGLSCKSLLTRNSSRNKVSWPRRRVKTVTRNPDTSRVVVGLRKELQDRQSKVIVLGNCVGKYVHRLDPLYLERLSSTFESLASAGLRMSTSSRNRRISSSNGSNTNTCTSRMRTAARISRQHRIPARLVPLAKKNLGEMTSTRTPRRHKASAVKTFPGHLPLTKRQKRDFPLAPQQEDVG